MFDFNVFAVLTATDEWNMASSAFRLAHNSKWFCGAEGGVAEESIIGSREGTPAIDADDQFEERRDLQLSAVDRLVITFDLLWENLQNGIQFGTDPNLCHILLGYRGTPRISRKQCNVTVDNNLKIWLHDHQSRYGTAVGYNGENENQVRKRETWILANKPGLTDLIEKTTIHIGNLAVEIEFPNHAIAHPDYVKNLRAFVDKCTTTAQTIADKGRGGDSTEIME